MYTISREFMREAVDFSLVQPFLQLHQMELARLNKLYRYYKGDHAILGRRKQGAQPNNRLVCNHAKYITDMSTGYLLGNPVAYAGNGIDELLAWYRKSDAPTKDMDLGKDCSVFGRAYELEYMPDEEAPTPRSAVIDPRNAFVVYSDDVEHIPLFGVYYHPVHTRDGRGAGYHVTVLTDAEKLSVRCSAGFQPLLEPERSLHPFGAVPLIEYWNNEERQGDYEQVITLIDAYNTLQSDRVNDKEQFIDAILVLAGANLGDESQAAKAAKALKSAKLLELPLDARAEYLTRQLNESDVELLKKSLEQDIHKLSNVPCLTDENFAGNSSGVAMKYKLLGFEQMTKTKERYFTEGLKKRLALYANIAAVKGGAAIDQDSISITFSRSLPVNEPELAQTVATLQNLVPDEILLTLLPFVKDVPAALDALKTQKEERAREQRKSFGEPPGKELEDGDEE